MALLLIPFFVSAVRINEVYYDPINTETGGEAVELYNPSNESVDISGYVLKTESSAEDCVLPNGAMISPHGYYLVADADFSNDKDNDTWPDADYEEAITMSNTDAGLALVFNNTIIDAVGWGDALNIDPGLYEGTPSNSSGEGYSLQRLNDTQNNIVDFIIAPPNFMNTQYSEETEISLTITVLNYHSNILSIFIEDDDNLTIGSQILPYPGGVRNVNVEMHVEDSNISNVERVWVVVKNDEYNLTENLINSTNALYTGNFPMEFYEVPENYSVEFHVINNYNLSVEENSSFEYLSLVSMEMDSSALECNIIQGQTCVLEGDNDLSTTGNVSIKNTGNVEIDFMVSGTEASSGNNVLNINDISYNFGSGFNILSENATLNDVNLASGSMTPLSFSIFIPENAVEGTYAGSINVVAEG